MTVLPIARLGAGSGRIRSLGRSAADGVAAGATSISFTAAGQQVAAAGNGLQDDLGVVGERNPDVADALHQRIVGHEDIGPNELHQFVFGNDAAAIARQVEQYIERFGPQRHNLACAREACRVRIKREPAEPKNEARAGVSITSRWPRKPNS